MKRCPRCGQQYTDSDINFCLNDGELLSRLPAEEPYRSPFSGGSEDPPPTVMMNPPRVTNPTDWQAPAQPMAQWQPAGSPQPQFSPYIMTPTPNQTLAIVSLCLGIGSMTIGWCCSAGLAMGPGAIITGFIALSMMKKDPTLYGGRGFAIGGIVTGTLFLAIYLLIMILYLVGIIVGGIS